MRLFTAIELPSELKEQLIALETGIRGATWVKAPALHLTLCFLGADIEPIRRMPIKMALASIQAAPFPLTLRGVGRFPAGGKRSARVLWVGIDEQPALMTLQAQIERALAEVDFPSEERAYHPHITLARLNGEASVQPFLEKNADFHAEPFTVSEFHLISSLLTFQGPDYQHAATFPFIK